MMTLDDNKVQDWKYTIQFEKVNNQETVCCPVDINMQEGSIFLETDPQNSVIHLKEDDFINIVTH